MTNHLKYVSFEFLWNVYELLAIMTLNFRQRDVLIEKIFILFLWMTYILYVEYVYCDWTWGRSNHQCFYLRVKQMVEMFFVQFLGMPRISVALFSWNANYWDRHSMYEPGYLIYFVVVLSIKYFDCVRIWIFLIFLFALFSSNQRLQGSSRKIPFSIQMNFDFVFWILKMTLVSHNNLLN